MNSFLAKSLVCVAILLTSLFSQLDAIAQVTKEMRSTSKVFPTTGPVTGRLVDEAGWPIVGALVVQYGKSKGYGYSEFDFPGRKFETNNRAGTDLNGNFKFESYDFDHASETETYFVHSKYAFRRVRSPYTVFGETVLSKGEDVTGYILSHDGEPIEGAEVGVSVPAEEITGVSHGRTKTDAEGRFTLPHAAVEGRASMWMRIPGQHSQWLTWYADEDVKGATEAVQRSPDQVVIGEDFEFRFRAPRPVKIKVVAGDTKQPISISRVMFRRYPTDAGRGFGIPIGQREIKANKNQIEYKYLQPGINRFWIFPEEKAQYPAVFIDVRLAEDEMSAPDVEIKIPRGATIRGRVADKVTGKPVEDALLEFLPEQPGKLLAAGIFVRQYCRTKPDGTFSVVVPATATKIQVIGDCGNYRAIPPGLADKLPQSFSKAADGTYVRAKAKFTIPEGLEKIVEPNSGENLDVGAFHLEEATKATGTVVDSKGLPLANVGILTTGSRYTSSQRVPFGRTDKNGRFEIGALFTNAIRDLPRSRMAKDAGPTADVFFFDVERGLSKMVTIKESEPSEIRVTLEDSPAAWGRVVDSLTGKPAEGVKVSGNGSVSRLILGATTDKDGSFLLEHLPRDGVSFSFSKEGYNHHHQRIQFLGQDKDRTLLDVDDIRLIKQFSLHRPKKPDVTGLSPAKSVDHLITHIATELRNISPRGPSLSWNSADPDTQLKTQVTKDVANVLDRLLDENESNEFQVAATLKILQALSTSQGGEMIAYSAQVKRMKQIMLKNLDQADVFDSYSRFRFAFESGDEYVLALDNNKTPEVRFWATQKMLRETEHDLGTSAQLGIQRTGPGEFKKRLAIMEKAWRIGLNEFPDEDSGGTPFQARILSSMTRVVAQIKQKPYDEERLSAIQAVIAELNE